MHTEIGELLRKNGENIEDQARIGKAQADLNNFKSIFQVIISLSNISEEKKVTNYLEISHNCLNKEVQTLFRCFKHPVQNNS